jgi:hypothetical protein
MNYVSRFFDVVADLRDLLPMFVIMFACVYALGITWAHNTQSAIYSQDIPDNLICRKDTYPDAYLCIVADQTVPWYLSSEGELANAR